METISLDTDALLRQVMELVALLGLPLSSDVEAIGRFSKGPCRVVICGRSEAHVQQTASHLRDTSEALEVISCTLSRKPDLHLWDAALLITPAFAALCSEELAFLKEAFQERTPAHVLVTQAEILGTAEQRTAAEGEIVRERLAPELSPLGIAWTFMGTADGEAPLMGLVKGLALTASKALHRRPILLAMQHVMQRAQSELAEQLERRDAERQRLTDLERRLPLAEAHLHEATRLAVLRCRDGVRSKRDALWPACEVAAGRLEYWLQHPATDQAEAIEPIETAWREFVEAADVAREQALSILLAEAERVAIAPFDLMAGLGFAARFPDWPQAANMGPVPEEWVEKIRALPIQSILDGALAIANQHAERRQTSTVNPAVTPTGFPKDVSLEQAHGEEEETISPWIGWFKTMLEQGVRFGSTPFIVELQLYLANEFDSLLGDRFAGLLEALTEDIQPAARDLIEAALNEMRAGTIELRTQLAERYAWETPMTQLLAMAETVASELQRPAP